MSKADLKAAMDSLQVKKPLRLPVQAPAFRAPPTPASQDERRSGDINISTELPTTEGVASSKDQSKIISSSAVGEVKTEVRIASTDQNSSLDEKKSQDAKPTVDLPSITGSCAPLESNAATDAEQSQDINASKVVPRASQPRRATEQDRAVTEATSVKSRLSTGYTRVPNSILMEMVSGDLSRNEIKLLLLVARMTISFNRPLVPLSKGVIERMTGVQGRAVLDAVQTLEKAGFLRKIPGDHNTPNRLGLIHEDMFSKTSGEKKSQDERGIEDATGSTDQKPPGRLDAASPHKKDSSETIDLRKKISLSNLLEPLREYFSNLKPRRKRETEFQAFEELRSDFSEIQIVLCLDFLLKNGTPGTGGPCHSPMAYLSKAIAQVLSEAESRSKATARREQENRERLSKEESSRELEEREAAEFFAHEREFMAAFPTDEAQAEVFAEYAKRFPMLPRNGSVLRRMVIREWWHGRTE